MIKVVFARGIIEGDTDKFAFGYENGLPWGHIKQDMEWFQESTKNAMVIMGSNTWRSLPRKLKGRLNVVLTEESCVLNKAGEAPDGYLTRFTEESIRSLCKFYPNRDICIIGGVSLIDTAIEFCDEVHVTNITTREPLKADVFIKNHDLDHRYVQQLDRRKYDDDHNVKQVERIIYKK